MSMKKKEEEEEDKEGEDEDEDKEGEDKKLAAKKKEEEGDEKSEKEVKWGDSSGELDNCVRVQGDAKDERSFEISEESATLVRIDEEEARTEANIFDEQLGQVCHSEAGEAGKKDYEAGEPGKKDSAENEVEREENSQLLKDIGLQVIKFKGIFHQFFFRCSNLIFWIVMGCGIADFVRRGL